MERYTKLTPEGYTAEGHSTEELLAALGKYEDLYESVAAELELVRLNLQELSKAGKARSATYTMLTGSRFMLEAMQKRLDEPASDVAGRLHALKRPLAPPDGGFPAGA